MSVLWSAIEKKQYCSAFHPEIKKVSTMLYWLASVVSRVTGRKEMKTISDFMAAFEKIGERGDPTESNNIVRTRITDKENGFA